MAEGGGRGSRLAQVVRLRKVPARSGVAVGASGDVGWTSRTVRHCAELHLASHWVGSVGRRKWSRGRLTLVRSDPLVEVVACSSVACLTGGIVRIAFDAVRNHTVVDFAVHQVGTFSVRDHRRVGGVLALVSVQVPASSGVADRASLISVRAGVAVDV